MATHTHTHPHLHPHPPTHTQGLLKYYIGNPCILLSWSHSICNIWYAWILMKLCVASTGIGVNTALNSSLHTIPWLPKQSALKYNPMESWKNTKNHTILIVYSPVQCIYLGPHVLHLLNTPKFLLCLLEPWKLPQSVFRLTLDLRWTWASLQCNCKAQ